MYSKDFSEEEKEKRNYSGSSSPSPMINEEKKREKRTMIGR
jgi:hypothetical protein